jgi:hypothetical protein
MLCWMARTKFEIFPSDTWQLLLQLFVATVLQLAANAVLELLVKEINIRLARRNTPMLLLTRFGRPPKLQSQLFVNSN